MTKGLNTKVKIQEQFGEATFEKGKPLPRRKDEGALGAGNGLVVGPKKSTARGPLARKLKK
jgi:hypothetical protein